MATTSPPGGSFREGGYVPTFSQPLGLIPSSIGVKEVIVPLALITQLLEAVGGRWTMDTFDLSYDPKESVRVEIQQDPLMYVITLEDK